MIISPSSDLGIAHRFFQWTLCSSRNILSKFQNFSQLARLVGIRLDQLASGSTGWHPARSVGIRLDRLAFGSTGSSSQLVWSTDFGDFGAQFLHGLGPWTPDQFWAVFWIHFGPYFGFLAAHHESIWILGGEAS